MTLFYYGVNRKRRARKKKRYRASNLFKQAALKREIIDR